jgi:hypothetical protein
MYIYIYTFLYTNIYMYVYVYIFIGAICEERGRRTHERITKYLNLTRIT